MWKPGPEARSQKDGFPLLASGFHGFWLLSRANLLGIKLYNHSFLDRQVDIFALRQSQDSSGHGLAVQLQPVRGSTAANQLQGADDLNIFLHFFFHANLVPHGNLERRNIDLLAIHQDMAVPNKLPGLGVGRSKTQPHENVVQSPLELSQEIFSGDAFLPDGLLEVGPELILEYAVNTLHLLLLAQLEPVSDDFRFAIVAVLSWSEVSFLNPASRLEAAFPF